MHQHPTPQSAFMIERTFQVPLDAPARLVADIAAYSALVELQAKMQHREPWFGRVA